MEDEIIIPEQEAAPAADTPVEVVDIQFRPGQKVYFFDPDGMEFAAGDHVIIDTARGAEFGICSGGNHTIPYKDVVSPLRPVLRKATSQDEKTVAENQETERKAYDICCQRIVAVYGAVLVPSTACTRSRSSRRSGRNWCRSRCRRIV